MLHEIYQWTRQETDTLYQRIIFSDEETFDCDMPCTALPSVPMELETPWEKIHVRLVPFLDGTVQVWKREVI